MLKVSIVSLGIGSKEHLTFKAAEVLKNSHIVYIMAQSQSWMVEFVQEIAPNVQIRIYFPGNVKWAEWHNDPVLGEISDEVLDQLKERHKISFALAGDCGIYSNFGPLEARFRERGIEWDMVPGVSFFNALPTEIQTVIVNEGDSLLLTRIGHSSELKEFIGKVSTVVLYNPNALTELGEFIKQYSIKYAKSVFIGVGGKSGKVIDLVVEPDSKPMGLVILKFP